MINRKQLWLYAGVVVLGVVLWTAGVSTTTIVTLALVALMMVMHLGGHTHGQGGVQRPDTTARTGRQPGGGHQH
ncbi:hypothetical protein V5H98_07635 [Georgenia sp. M64]|uniref:hypothetical protein n=1 Tax=Georgenia sp. M64 TaxID=3120520 RepID=UPI0030DFA2D2